MGQQMTRSSHHQQPQTTQYRQSQQQHVQHHGYASGYAHAHAKPQPQQQVPFYPSFPLPSPPKKQKHPVLHSSTDEEMVSDIIDSLFQSDEFIISESSDTN